MLDGIAVMATDGGFHGGEGVTRAVLVTGGARRIGAAIVAQLAAAGHDVAIHHHRSAADAEALAARMRGQGVQATTLQADLSEPGSAQAIIDAAAAGLGRPIDGLVNCASLFDYDRPPSVDFALFDTAMRTNAAMPIALAGALARQPGLVDGAVVNILDQKVANLNPDFFSYTCSKAALEAATSMLAQALAPRVRVNAVSPGLTLPSHDQTDEEFRAVAAKNLLQRAVAIDDIGRAVNFLMTTPSITGQNIFVDCGQRFITRPSDVMFDTRGAGDA